MMKRNNETSEIIRNTMVKKVNVIAQIPIRNVYPPIYGTYKGIYMSPANILKCLMHKAVVEEVLEDGSIVPLNTKNYNTVNKPVVVVEPKLENRKSAVTEQRDDVRNITMKKLETHTAPLPESHYLYNIKDKCESETPMSNTEATELDEKYVNNLAEKNETTPERELPTVEFDEETGEEVESKGDSL